MNPNRDCGCVVGREHPSPVWVKGVLRASVGGHLPSGAAAVDGTSMADDRKQAVSRSVQVCYLGAVCAAMPCAMRARLGLALSSVDFTGLDSLHR